ncbi:hypothetical protein V8G54_018245 [Vigna mungo]|uniref:Uncharacterized protein n=1 Tax=Vigna mungo TaxID=3915 RepID=A0AAQ3RR95_VIGMU
MEEITGVGNDSETGIQWWWGVAAAAQMGLGMRSYAKGYAGDSRFMPLKAFTVASLFVGSAASASILLLQSNGINGGSPFCFGWKDDGHVFVALNLKEGLMPVEFLGSASYQGSLSLKEDSSVYTAARVGRKKLWWFSYFEVEDLMEAGANLRAKLGLPPRTQNK